MRIAAYDVDRILREIGEAGEFRPFDKAGEGKWLTLDKEAKDYLLEKADEAMKKDWPALPVSLYREYVVNGDRSHYENVYFERRRRIRTLSAAECLQNEGRYIPAIANGLWAICEETTWVLPAHIYKKGEKNDNLPTSWNKAETRLDLFCAETASCLAWTVYLLGDKLDAYSVQIAQRIRYEVERRVFEPYREDRYGWMGFCDDHPVNNWNPWINANVLSCALILGTDERTLRRVLLSARRFTDGYAPDGGCDEGPSYFTAAGEAMLDIIALLRYATNGKTDLFRDEGVRAMADYIRKAYVAGNWFVNYADAPARLTDIGEAFLEQVARWAELPELERFARMRMTLTGVKPENTLTEHDSHCYRTLEMLLGRDSANYASKDISLCEGAYFDGIQVMNAREKKDSDRGFFVSAKGGHNDESHNHNDVGQYIVYLDGEPVLIDPGTVTYTSKTFSAQRYEIWVMQSGWHNLPRINGIEQKDGREYQARDVLHTDDGKKARLTMDIAGAYPGFDGKYTRTVELDREKGEVTVTDVPEGVNELALSLVFADEPEMKTGRICVNGAVMEYDDSRFTAAKEERVLDDKKVSSAWMRESLWRVTLTAAGACAPCRFVWRRDA